MIIDCAKGVAKAEVDVNGREIPAALDSAGGCPMAPIVAGPPLTVVLGVDPD